VQAENSLRFPSVVELVKLALRHEGPVDHDLTAAHILPLLSFVQDWRSDGRKAKFIIS
jgi:hypothetical protein